MGKEDGSEAGNEASKTIHTEMPSATETFFI